MNSERKEIRKFLKKSLKSDFEKILYEAKMTADEKKSSAVFVVRVYLWQELRNSNHDSCCVNEYCY